MNSKRLAMGLLGATLSLGWFTAGNAQTTITACPTGTTTTNLYPSVSTTTSTPMTTTAASACPTNPCVGVTPCPTSLSGQVSTTQAVATTHSGGFLGIGAEDATALTTSPGSGEISLDRLGFGNKLTLTLVNPTDVPMRFDTVRRVGRELSWVVPPHSQRVVSYRYWNPVSDEVRFMVYQDPADAIAANTLRGQQTAVEPTIQQQQAVVTPPPTMTQVVPPPQPSGSAAVRGYW
jgi:hypothetical protein